MSVVLSKAPFRVSLGGGGTDLETYYSKFGGFLIAGAIDKYIYLLTHALFQNVYRLKYSKFEEVETPQEIEHPIIRETILNHWDGPPLEISSVADIPAGTGLGSSGAFTVALLQALALLSRKATNPALLAEQASHIEIDLLGEPIGKQDQYVSAHGGICAYTFNTDGTVDVEPLNIQARTLQLMEDNLLLFFTGQTRTAGSILADQNSRSKSNDPKMIENLHATKQIGMQGRELLESGNMHDYGLLLDEHWQIKRVRSDLTTNGRIDSLYEYALTEGAIGGKLVGAGGGGFLLMYTDDPDRLRSAFARKSLTEVRFGFDFHGVTTE